MQVRNGLACRSAFVDADVVTRRVQLAIKVVAGRSQEGHQVAALGVRDFEERRHVSLRDDQRVAGRNREAVANDDREFAVLDDAICGQ